MAIVKRLFLFALCVLLLHDLVLIRVASLETYQEAQESDRVVNLPGQPSSPLISQFSGYVPVNEEHGRALFYWFFEAESEASEKPLLLWLNGGPGCSSLAGAIVELSPFRVGENGTYLHYNKYSWSKEANVLFLESPAGVGFSYTNTSSDLTGMYDALVAEDAYNFLLNWLQRFPQYKTHDFFIAGESYAGHFVPQLAELVYDRNKNTTKYPFINLKGFMVGNPATNDYYDYKGLLEYAWSHAVISDQLYNEAKNVCDFTVFNWSDNCNAAMTMVFDEYTDIDIYNIYGPSCLINTTSSAVSSFESLNQVNNKYGKRRLRIRGGYDPCYTIYAEEYFNRADVQLSLHAKNKEWNLCNYLIYNTYNYTIFSMLPVYTKLIKGGLKIWMYSGDTDGRVPVIGSRYCVEALGLPLKSPWRSWFHRRQVGGRIVEYEGLTFVTVRGAGHQVPLLKPSEALSVIHSYLSGRPLPT